MTYPLCVHYITVLCVSSILAELTEAADDLAAKMTDTGTRSDDQSYDYKSNRLSISLRFLLTPDWVALETFETPACLGTALVLLQRNLSLHICL